MKRLRIVFMGSPEFAVPSLEKLIGGSHKLVAVVSGTDKKRGRGNELTPTPVKAVAQKAGIPVVETDSTKTPEFLQAMQALRPDLFIVVAFKILPKSILAVPTIGSINIHASLLPKYRGAAPIHWAVINGEKKTGNTIFLLNEVVDAGAILARSEIEIGPDETSGSVYARLMLAGAALLPKVVDDLANGSISPIPQKDEEATPAPKVFADMAQIHFTTDSATVHNRIRGFSPHPGPWASMEGVRIKLFGSRENKALTLPEGEVRLADDGIFVGCKSGAVYIEEIQFPGKSRVKAGLFLKTANRKIKFDLS